MGGTILKMTATGDEVHILYCTGTQERLGEAYKCCDILGVKTTHYLDQTDGELEATSALVNIVRELQDEHDFDRVYCPNTYEKHPDHLAAFDITVQAFPSKRIYQYEIWTPLRNPDIATDITYYLSLKRAAIRAHQSQMINGFDEAIIALNRYRGIMSGTNAYAMEAFRHATDN